jgi:hypothetical protein
MMTSLRRKQYLGCLLLLAASLQVSSVRVCSSDDGYPTNVDEETELTAQKITVELTAQKITVARITQLCMVIRDFRTREGRTPNNLDALVNGETQYVVPAYAVELFVDGWGKRFFYHSTGESFVLASFGKNGIPESEGTQRAGGWSPQFYFDSDIVSIDGNWAQTPNGLPR